MNFVYVVIDDDEYSPGEPSPFFTIERLRENLKFKAMLKDFKGFSRK